MPVRFLPKAAPVAVVVSAAAATAFYPQQSIAFTAITNTTEPINQFEYALTSSNGFNAASFSTGPIATFIEQVELGSTTFENSAGDTLTLLLYAATGGASSIPTGTPLASDNISVNIPSLVFFQLNTLTNLDIPNVTSIRLDPLTSYALALQGDNDTLGWSLPASLAGGGITYLTANGFTSQGRAFTVDAGSTWNSVDPVFGDLIYSISVRETSVPGPLPAIGAAAAFGYSRKLRKRIAMSKEITVARAIN